MQSGDLEVELLGLSLGDNHWQQQFFNESRQPSSFSIDPPINGVEEEP